jgi:hypothetical protein
LRKEVADESRVSEISGPFEAMEEKQQSSDMGVTTMPRVLK